MARVNIGGLTLALEQPYGVKLADSCTRLPEASTNTAILLCEKKLRLVESESTR